MQVPLKKAMANAITAVLGALFITIDRTAAPLRFRPACGCAAQHQGAAGLFLLGRITRSNIVMNEILSDTLADTGFGQHQECGQKREIGRLKFYRMRGRDLPVWEWNRR